MSNPNNITTTAELFETKGSTYLHFKYNNDVPAYFVLRSNDSYGFVPTRKFKILDGEYHDSYLCQNNKVFKITYMNREVKLSLRYGILDRRTYLRFKTSSDQIQSYVNEHDGRGFVSEQQHIFYLIQKFSNDQPKPKSTLRRSKRLKEQNA